MLRNYLAAALRNLARNRLYAGVTIFGLAVGFAVALLIALFVRDEFSYDRFVAGHERVYRVSETIRFPGGRPIVSDVTPTRVAPALKLDFPQIQYVARLTGLNPVIVRRGDFTAAEQNMTWADPDFFRVMPMPVVAGDPAGALDAPDGVVITRAVARKYFGRDAPLGEVLLIDRHPMRVNAVLRDLPSATHLPFDIYASARAPQSMMRRNEKVDTPLNNTVATYFRLRPGVPIAQIEAGLPQFIHRHFPPNQLGDLVKDGIALQVVPLADIHLRPSTQGAFKPAGDAAVTAAVAGIGALIVLVAAINFVTLMTARAGRRAVEVGVRKAAGGRRRDLVVQFMGEAMVYVVVAALLAVAFAELLLPAFNALLQRQIRFDYLTNLPLAGGIVGVVLAVGLLAGAYPAFVLSAFRPAVALKGGIAQTAGGVLIREALVVVQFAVLIALTLIAFTIARQTLFALNQGMRLDKDQVVLMAARPCTDSLRDAMLTVPGVERAACASAQALSVGGSITNKVRVDGRDVLINISPVDFDFFAVYGVKPLAGRLFDKGRPADGYIQGAPTNPPLVVNETAVRKLGFASPAAAVGRTVIWPFHTELDTPYGSDPERPSQIVGVVPDFTFGSMRDTIEPTMFMVGPKTSYYAVALNLRLDKARIPEALAGIDRVWKRVGGGDPIQRYFVKAFTMRLYLDTLKLGALVVISAIVAVSIAALGLFALSAYTTERRTKEIGIRKAMGASSPDILRLLLWQFTKPVLAANLIALPAAWLVMRWWLSGFAYHVSMAAWTFVVAAAAAVFIAWATVFVHALKVARARPVAALRYE